LQQLDPMNLICGAINRRRILAFAYKGERRLAEPYILGFDDKGKLRLSAVQVEGGSGKGFRTFDVKLLSQIEITEIAFLGKHPDYYPRDPYFERVVCQV